MPSRLTVVLVSLLLATPAVIFWLWLVILPARVAVLCPEECWCEPGGYHVECIHSSLNSIPLIFPTGVRGLLLRENNITSLERNSFSSRELTELEELTADFCQLRTIELGAFNGLKKLTRLSMWGNEISEIIPRTFETTSQLEYLVLANNKIEYLEVNAFLGLINLKHIILGVNKLQYVHPELLVGLPNVGYLNLVNNPSLEVPTDRQFIKSRTLKRLDMSHCNISSVSVETFANVTALEWLDLSKNNLRNADINMFKVLPKLSALYLYGNPLQCDCQLQEVWRWRQDHHIQTVLHGTPPECDTPSEVQGIWWGVLEKGQCLQDNMHYYGDYKNTRYRHIDRDLDEYHLTFLTEFQALDVNYLTFLQEVQVPLYAFPFIAGITGNIILLIIIICNKGMRTVPNMYILNLAISDMIYLTVYFYEACASRTSDTWKDGDFMSKFFPFCRRMSVGLSAYSIVVLSIRRYRVTVNPFHARVSAQSTRRATVATICGVWVVAALFALPSALSMHSFAECYNTYCIMYYQYVIIFELLVSSVLPLCVIAFCYIMTARHLLKSTRLLWGKEQHLQLNNRKNTARIILGLAFVFVISNVPYHIFWAHIIFKDHWIFGVDNMVVYKGFELQYTYTVSTCLLLINSCFNPVAIFCTSRAFRRQLKRPSTWCCRGNPSLIKTRI